MKKLLLLTGASLLFLFSCKEQRSKDVWYADRFSFAPPTYVCYRAPGPITIDGKMTPGEWDAIPWTTEFVDIEGDTQPRPYLPTKVKMAYDDEGMYFGAWLEEPHVWGTITTHDAVIFQDNDFEVFLNPTNDTHNYLEYEVNALGTVWDLFLSKPYRDNPAVLNNWEFQGMQSAVYVEGTVNKPEDTDRYWSVELFIPWSSLYQVVPGKSKPAEGKQMRVNFSRVQWTTEVKDGKYVKIPMPGETKIREHNWVWAPTGVINIHLPEYWGFVQFTGTVAGTTEVPFVWNPDEDIKWKLRQLYYRQREYKQAYGMYASLLADLKPEEIFEEKELKKMRLETTSSLYELSFRSEKNHVWSIRQDGLIWKTTPPPAFPISE